MATLNTHLTTTSALSPEMQTYYDRKLLKDMKPKLVHLLHGQKKPIPKNNGKTVNFRKFTPFAAITTPLGEGVVPNGQLLAMSEQTATVAQYGGYVAASDLLDMTAIDPVVSECIELMADQGALSLDTACRTVMLGGTNDQIAGALTYRYEAKATNVFSTTEIRKAVRTLENNKAPKFSRGGKQFYIGIISPNTKYDLQSDTLWLDVSKYQDKEAIFAGEVGMLFGVVFIETTQAATITAANLTAAARALNVLTWTDGTKTLAVDEAITTAEATALAGRKILISDEGTTGKPGYYATIASATAGAAGAAALVLTQNQAAIGVTPADGADIVYPGEAGYAGVGLEATLIFGRDAYGIVSVDGSDNVKSIIKPAGSAGTADPLNQISTVGWKVDAFAATILQDAWIVRVEHGVSA